MALPPDRIERDARSGERFGADKDGRPGVGLLGAVRPARVRDGQRQVHRRRFEAKTGGDVAGRGEFRGRGFLGEHDAGVHEVDRAVAVAILQDDAGFEEV